MDTISTTTWMVIAFLAIGGMAALGAWMIVQKRRTDRLRTQFGPEYVRELNRTQDQRRVEGTLDDRVKRVERLHIRSLPPRDRARFLESWHMVQSQFVDNPGAAMGEADRLVSEVMIARGYPAADPNFEQRAADISVDHPKVVENYRMAHDAAVLHSRGKASTEELRQAMIHFRSVFEDLISEPSQIPVRVAS